MSTFLYPPLDLDQNSIRLLRVEKGAWPSDVFCSLFEATTNPDEVVPYKALSYTWGAVDSEDHAHARAHLSRIIVNEQEFPATDNLRLALSYIQNPSHDIMLWTDAICINQGDDREKGHQVKQMAQIYKNAEEVLIWLGPSSEELKGLLNFVTSVDKQAIGMFTSGAWASHCHNLMRDQFMNAKTTQNAMALKQLMGRRWFKRIWVLQEIAFARSARIICGSSSCSARTFSLMPSFFEIPTTDHSQAVLDLMPRIRSHTWWARDRTLQNLLVKFQQSQATDSRDMIYALLSMSQDACDSTRFYPSYEITRYQVPRNTASFLIFGRMHASRAELPDVPIGHLALPLAELITFLLEPALRNDHTLKKPSPKHHPSKNPSPKHRTLEEMLSEYDTFKRTSHRDRILERTFSEYRKWLLGRMDKSFSAFIEQLHRIDLNTVQMLHCLSTFLSIALTSPRSLKAWFRIRTPKLLTAIGAERGELQTRTKEKPERILTLIFDQQNEQEEYRLMEFPIFDRFGDLERLHFPEDFDLPDRPDGYDSFGRFTSIQYSINQE